MVSLNFVGRIDAGYDNTYELTLSAEVPGVNAAPAAVWFTCTSVSGTSLEAPEADDVFDEIYHNIIFDWDFGDPASSTFDTDLNMPNHWKDANIGRGRKVAHVFSRPDTYTVTCRAYEPATRRFGIRTINVTIGDPVVEFARGRTIIYDPNGTADTSAYVDPTVRSNWVDVISARNARGTSSTAQILLAPDVDLTFNRGDPNITAGNWANLRLGALDPDAQTRPKIRSSGRFGTGGGDAIVRDWGAESIECVVFGIDFVGEWDSTAEVGPILRPLSIFKNGGSYVGDNYLFALHKCSFDGFELVNGTSKIGPTKPYYMMHSDCSVTNWQNYGFACGDGDTNIHAAFVGVSAAQHEDALSGGTKNGLYNNHGSIRHFFTSSLYMSVCDLFTRTGWFVGGEVNGYRLSQEQPALRINTNGAEGVSSYFDRLAVEGQIYLGEQLITRVDVPGNHVFDKVLQVSGSRIDLPSLMDIRFGGTTVRNALSIKLNLPDAVDNPVTNMRFVEGNNSLGSAENGPAGVRVYNVTGIDLRTDENANNAAVSLFDDGNVAFSVKLVENNLLHEPNRSTAQSVPGQTVDLGAALDGFAPRHKGPRPNFLHQEGAFVATISGSGGTFDIPYSEITDQSYNGPGINDGAPTDQPYWQATQAVDTRHMVRVGGRTFLAEAGEISVSFGPTGVTITNQSDVDWSGGWRVRLDRKSRLPEFDPVYDSTTQDLEIVIDATDQNTVATAGGDAPAFDDFMAQVRPATDNVRGAL